MKILNGNKEANQIFKKVRKKIKQKKITPTLAVFLVGSNEASEVYIEKKKEKGAEIGIKVKVFRFPAIINQNTLLNKIKELNNSSNIDGIIVQLPLPENLNTTKVISTIDPKKDVDGFHKKNLKLLASQSKKPYLYPVLPQAIYFALEKSGKNLEKCKIAALVNSNIFGKTLKTYFKRKGIGVKYLKEKKGKILKKSDIIISAKGEKNLINEGCIKDKVALIDAGFSRDEKGNIAGDVDKKSIKGKASFLTPVPGGVGPLTVAFLLKNTYLAKVQYD